MSNGVKLAPAKKLKITPEQNAKTLKLEVEKKLRLRYLEKFEEFIEDSDSKLLKANEAIDDNEFAKNVVFESEKADDPRSKAVINSFQTAIDMTKGMLIKTTGQREAAIELRKIVKANKPVSVVRFLQLFDVMVGA